MHIDKQVPIPEMTHFVGNKKYNFDALGVGDSVLDTDAKTTARSLIAKAAHAWARKTPGRKVTARKTGEGIRVWRIQ